MSSVQNVEVASAIYANLFDQSAGSELYKNFLSAREIAGSRNSNEVRVRRFGAFTAGLYGGAGSIDPSADYQRPNDTTITVNFNETALVPVGVDEIEHELTEIGFMGSESGLAQDAAAAVRDFVVQEILVTAEAGATALTANAELTPAQFIEAGKFLDGQKVPKAGRIAIVDSQDAWDMFDGSSKLSVDARNVPDFITNGIIPNVYGFTVFTTTLLPEAAGVTQNLFAHMSSMIAKTADELPRVKIMDDHTSIGHILQIFQRYGKVVADANRIAKIAVGP